MAYRVTLIPGDGTGPEIAEATRRALEGTGVEFDWDVQDVGADIMEKEGTPLPDRVIESLRTNKVGIKGPVTTPIGSGFRSVNVSLRKQLDLYACLRPCKYYPGVKTPIPNVDLVVVRENTEDLYAGIEFEKGSPEIDMIRTIVQDSGTDFRADSGLSLKVISETGTRRIVKFAFEYAKENGRKKVTAVSKANIMKFTDGLFYDVAREVAKDYPDIEYEEYLIDALCMQLVLRPHNYDVLVLPNLYGDIISDLCAGLMGGLGVAPGANIGDDAALFEPIHGSAPKYTGQNKVNPMAMMFSGVLMLRYLKETAAADRLEQAMASIIEEGKYVTYDMKADRNDPTAIGTSEVADAIIERMQSAVTA
jgi:isocitrate dehydrogenase (NAD+)